MNYLDELSGLKVFSEKLNDNVTITIANGAIVTINNNILYSFVNSWEDDGWSNNVGWWDNDNWIDNSWSNNIGSWDNNRWVDNGWSNNTGPWDNNRWVDNGWSNNTGPWDNNRWVDSGWSNNTRSRGCFITTACIDYMGLDDNCNELQILRHYRDILVEQDELFRDKVLEYYQKAPLIVDKILNSPNKEEHLKSIYKNLIEKCVNLLKNGQIDEAKKHYLTVYQKLIQEYDF